MEETSVIAQHADTLLGLFFAGAKDTEVTVMKNVSGHNIVYVSLFFIVQNCVIFILCLVTNTVFKERNVKTQSSGTVFHSKQIFVNKSK